MQRETYRKVLTKMLTQRRGALPEEAGEAMKTAELAQREKWFDLALDGAAVADMFAGATHTPARPNPT